MTSLLSICRADARRMGWLVLFFNPHHPGGVATAENNET
jgi:hypothetical protein